MDQNKFPFQFLTGRTCNGDFSGFFQLFAHSMQQPHRFNLHKKKNEEKNAGLERLGADLLAGALELRVGQQLGLLSLCSLLAKQLGLGDVHE